MVLWMLLMLLAILKDGDHIYSLLAIRDGNNC